MSNEKLPLSSAGTPGMVVGADSPLLSFLSGISGASPSSNITAPPSHDVLGFSPILSTSNGHVLTSTTGGATSTITSLPLDAELDQLMKSLGGPVDATKVSSEDIDKLLGSINVDFSSGAALSGALVSSSSIDPLAAFSIDIGVDLKASVSLSSAVSSGPTSEPMFTLNPLSGVSSSSFGATDISYAGLHSASPGLPGIDLQCLDLI
ncbi:hypothetical protein EV174_001246 [Coemansia sp. RSA 2320]|nr:hypothetical protein EV174_001246 [Coemansia sp. RSA 2320]